MRTPYLALLLAVPMGACGEEIAPPAPGEVMATSGDGQVAPVLRPLPAPLVATVRDRRGAPITGVRMTWSAVDGRILPIDQHTDGHGRARARWVLGERAGAAQAQATVEDLAPATFTATARPLEPLPPGELRTLTLVTYDESGQVVHPDYAAAEGAGFGYLEHLAITPYPFGDAHFENPSLYVGAGKADRWVVEPGGQNPIVRPGAGYLSDPDLVFDPDAGQLRLYYREATSENVVWLVRSADGVSWSAPVAVARRPSHEIVSPAVVRRGPGEWYLWSVNSGPAGCGASRTSVEVRRSPDGIVWSSPEPVQLEQPDFWAWHIDVQWIPEHSEFWALYNAKLPGSCTTPAVFLASSPDGYTWSVVGQPVLAKGRHPTLQDIVYRGSFAYDAETDLITFWYSGARYQDGRYVWGAAVERRAREEVFLQRLGELSASLFDPPPAPLLEWP